MLPLIKWKRFEGGVGEVFPWSRGKKTDWLEANILEARDYRWGSLKDFREYINCLIINYKLCVLQCLLHLFKSSIKGTTYMDLLMGESWKRNLVTFITPKHTRGQHTRNGEMTQNWWLQFKPETAKWTEAIPPNPQYPEKNARVLWHAGWGWSSQFHLNLYIRKEGREGGAKVPIFWFRIKVVESLCCRKTELHTTHTK